MRIMSQRQYTQLSLEERVTTENKVNKIIYNQNDRLTKHFGRSLLLECRNTSVLHLSG